MARFKQRKIFLFSVLLSKSVFANLLSEEELLKIFREQSVPSKQFESQKAQTDFAASSVQEIFQANLKSDFVYSKSDETGTTFQPTLTPYESISVGIQKKTAIGLATELSYFGKKYSAPTASLLNETQMGLKLGFQLDLWKNIFGTLDRLMLGSAEIQKKKGEIEFRVNVKKSENEIRKIYWSLVASDENIRLTQELLKSAELQSQDAVKRQRSGVADKGEVAKYQSLVESRKASLLLFEYERAQLLSAFENQITGFDSMKWKVDSSAISTAKTEEIKSCLADISKRLEPNMEFSKWDELIGLTEYQEKVETQIAGKHADMNFGLQGYIQTSGLGDSYSSSADAMSDFNKGWGLGFYFQVPLGFETSRSEKFLRVAKEMGFKAQKESLLNNFKATHVSILKGLKLLGEGLKTQEQNSQNLTTNYNEVKTKFNQGRIPLAMLVSEQDLLFQSRLQEINIKKMIAHTLLDYFSVFTEHSCVWNQK